MTPNDTLQALERYAVVILPALVVAEQIGIPLPAVPALLAVGALAAQGRVSVYLILASIAVVAIVVDQGWYELGRFKVKRAPLVIKTDELQAVAMFREGLEAEQEALRLLESGKVVMWTGEEELHAREILAVDLANANEVMADQDSLLNALRMRTY